MRRFLAAAVALLALALPAGAGAAVHLISITSPVHRSGWVTLSVSGVPFGSVCSIRVHFGSRHPLVAPGLYPKSSSFLLIHWRWQVPRGAIRGRWSVDLACRGAGSLHTSYLVR